MLKRVRIFILLFILLTVGLSAWRTSSRLASWEHTLQVVVYPVNADGSAATQLYMESLKAEDFAPIASYLEQEGKNYGLNTLFPVRVNLAPAVREIPPAIPRAATAFDALQWSLSLRYWAWRHASDAGIRPDVRLFLLYHDPATQPAVPDSAGLAKGQIGIAHLFAGRAQHGSNLVVTTHELLHTLGASDKYDRSNNQPLFPAGFADPQQNPLYPQERAELMAGRIAVAADRAEIPRSLAETVVGRDSAREIGWSKK